jgi:hypothetical protein
MAKKKSALTIKAPPYNVGDTLTTGFKSLHYTIHTPIKVMAIRQTEMCMSGWMISILTSEGEKELDSGHFMLVK